MHQNDEKASIVNTTTTNVLPSLCFPYLHPSQCAGSDPLRRLASCIRHDTRVVVLTLTTIQNFRIATIFTDEAEQTGKSE